VNPASPSGNPARQDRGPAGYFFRYPICSSRRTFTLRSRADHGNFQAGGLFVINVHAFSAVHFAWHDKKDAPAKSRKVDFGP